MPTSFFYIPSAESLKGFEQFTVTSSVEKAGSGSVEVWAVTGHKRGTGQPEPIADFHAQSMASTFRDMCEIVAG